MRTEAVAELLRDRGYTVETSAIIKNGVEKKGLIVKTDKLCPTFYVEQMEDKSDLEIADKIVELVEHSEDPDIDISHIADREYILENVIPAIQHESAEDIVKFKMLDLEIYFRVVLSQKNGIASYKVSNELLETVGIDKQELLDKALKNIEPHIKVCSMAQMLSEKLGFEISEMEAEIPLFVGRSDLEIYGASAMLNNRIMEEIADKLNCRKLAIIPSSIEEILILKLENETREEIENINAMITDVNANEVGPELYLSSHCYIWEEGALRLANY